MDEQFVINTSNLIQHLEINNRTWTIRTSLNHKPQKFEMITRVQCKFTGQHQPTQGSQNKVNMDLYLVLGASAWLKLDGHPKVVSLWPKLTTTNAKKCHNSIMSPSFFKKNRIRLPFCHSTEITSSIYKYHYDHLFYYEITVQISPQKKQEIASQEVFIFIFLLIEVDRSKGATRSLPIP